MLEKCKWLRTVPPVSTSENGSDSTGMNETDRLLCLILDIGVNLLRCGGEINRVEDTVERLCRAYDPIDCEVFAIPSLIMAAIRMPDGSYSSQIRRVHGSSKDLYRLEKFNALSRRICREKPSADEIEAAIGEARSSHAYAPVWIFIGSLLASGAFAIFFGGSRRDALAASLVGLAMTLIDYFGSYKINDMAKMVVMSFVLGVLSVASVRVGIGEDVGYVTIGAIMLLVPGVEMGNALRDLLGGNLLSGTLRTIQTLLLAMMIAFGYAAAILMMGGVA